jgi:hypothetical protein
MLFNEEEIANLRAAGWNLEEAFELRARTVWEWENLKRLWDGKPLLKKPKYRSIDDDAIPQSEGQ